MAQTYFAILTAVGEAKDANAKALGIPFVITEMSVGDGNGELPTPVRTQTELVNQVRIAPINQLSKDENNPNQIIAEQVIPENVGGWWIRELGLYDEEGDLVAVANCPPTYKPLLAEGSGRTQVVRMVLIVTSADSVQLKIDPAVVLATKQFTETAISVAMTAHMSGSNPHPVYPLFVSISNLPTEDVGPVCVVECGEIWLWSSSAYFEGYRSPLCGRPLDGHTLIPLVSEVDAVGGQLLKADYASVWGYAQENGLVVDAASWVPGTHNFVDVDDDYFQMPDLRDMFRRYTGTDADTANARALGSYQADEVRSHSHDVSVGIIGNQGLYGSGSGVYGTNVIASMPTGGAETRPVNTAFHPRIHV